MSERLSALDVSFLYLESPTTAMHVGEVAIFKPSDGADAGDQYDALRRLVGHRISMVPRYRQKVRFVPGRIANPVWVDDEAFDLSYHVRRSALPRPGTLDQLLAYPATAFVRALREDVDRRSSDTAASRLT